VQRFKNEGLWKDLPPYALSVAAFSQNKSNTSINRQWARNVTQAQQDTMSFYQEAAMNVGQYNSYGWNAWRNDENPRALGIKAFLMRHMEQRCASAQRMIYAAGFDHVSMVKTHDIKELNVGALVASGKVSGHFQKGDTIEQLLKYVANAVDHCNILEIGLRQNYSWVAVFEDDIILTTSPSIASTRIRGALASLPREADTLHMEYCYDACKMSSYSNHNQWASAAYEPYCSAAILYSAQGIRKLLGNFFQKSAAAVDRHPSPQKHPRTNPPTHAPTPTQTYTHTRMSLPRTRVHRLSLYPMT